MKKRPKTKPKVNWNLITPEKMVAVVGRKTTRKLNFATALLGEFRKLDDRFILAMAKLAKNGPWAQRIASGLLLFEANLSSDPLSGLLRRPKAARKARKTKLETFEDIGTDHIFK